MTVTLRSTFKLSWDFGGFVEKVVWDKAMNPRGYPLKRPILESPAQRGSFHRPQVYERVRKDFTSWSIWKGREICHFGRWKAQKVYRCVLSLWERLGNVLVLWFIQTVKPLLSGPPVKRTPSIKRTLGRVPEINVLYICIYNEPLLSGRGY